MVDMVSDIEQGSVKARDQNYDILYEGTLYKVCTKNVQKQLRLQTKRNYAKNKDIKN